MLDTTHFHPMLVHFPIALTMVGLLLEVVRLFFSKTETKLPNGELLLYFGAVSAVFALLSGYLFTGSFSGKTLEVRNLHRLLAVLSTVMLSLASLLYLFARFRKKNQSVFRMIGLMFYVISAILIGATGYVGGNLVYKYMIGL
jgi:uncharacterized membrane protein